MGLTAMLVPLPNYRSSGYYSGRCRGRELKLKFRFKLLNQSAE